MDDIAGLAISAGSRLIFLTNIGIMLPSIFANTTIAIIATQMVNATATLCPSNSQTLKKLNML